MKAWAASRSAFGRAALTGALLAAGLLLLGARPALAQRHVAFGDSITAGEGDDPERPPGQRGYPFRLETLLRANGEPEATVANRGVGAERTTEGLERIDQVLAEEHGDVLLLMEGTNDITRGISHETTLTNLAEMARRAENAGYEVVHATAIPRIPAANVDSENVLNQIMNQEIRDLAGRTGRQLADNFYAFGILTDPFATHYWDDPNDHVGHPNEDGYDLMADVYLDVLTGTDSVPPVPGVLSPAHGERRVSPGAVVRVDLWDFGAGTDLGGTALLIDDAEVTAEVSGNGRQVELVYAPPQPLSAVVRVGLRTRDLSTPANSFTGEIARFVIEGTVFLEGDFDEDGRVDGSDLVYFGHLFGSTDGSARWDSRADFNSDDVIDGEDLAVIASNFGQSSF